MRRTVLPTDAPAGVVALSLLVLALAGCNQILGIQDLIQLDATPSRPPCTSAAECSADLPRCDLDQSVCSICGAETDCAPYAGTPHCGSGGACDGCRDSDDCAATSNACDPISHQCRACAKDDECPSNVCDQDQGVCVPAANVLYVDNKGSGTNCTKTEPCKTLIAAHQRVAGDRKHILLATGTL